MKSLLALPSCMAAGLFGRLRHTGLVVTLALACGSTQAAPQPSFEPNSVQTVDFNAPQRVYIKAPGAFEVYAEASLAGDPAAHAAAVQKLAKALEDVVAALPAHARGQMRSIRYFLMMGLRSPQGGLKGGMRYVAAGSRNPLWDSRWQGGIVVYSADNLMAMSAAQAQRALAHEMAHARHLTRWSAREPGIYGPWEAAASQGLYRNVQGSQRTHGRSGVRRQEPGRILRRAVGGVLRWPALRAIRQEWTEDP